MSLFSERHGMRAPLIKTSTVTPEMYRVIFQCCEKYFDYLAHIYPEKCPDNNSVCCGFDLETFRDDMIFEIPTLYQGYGAENDQYALLDLIEFVAINCKDYKEQDYHSFFGHHHLVLLDTSKIFTDFRTDINKLFGKMGLLFTLTTSKIVERVVENYALLQDAVKSFANVAEKGAQDLFKEAVAFYKHREPQMRKNATERIWDTFERLKTYYTNLDKKASSARIVSEISDGRSEYIELLNAEFVTLTKIGNDFRIRHHETNKIDITNELHYDYFFNRCLSLLALVLKTLENTSAKTVMLEDDDLPW